MYVGPVSLPMVFLLVRERIFQFISWKLTGTVNTVLDWVQVNLDILQQTHSYLYILHTKRETAGQCPLHLWRAGQDYNTETPSRYRPDIFLAPPLTPKSRRSSIKDSQLLFCKQVVVITRELSWRLYEERKERVLIWQLKNTEYWVICIIYWW